MDWVEIIICLSGGPTANQNHCLGLSGRVYVVRKVCILSKTALLVVFSL